MVDILVDVSPTRFAAAKGKCTGYIKTLDHYQQFCNSFEKMSSEAATANMTTTAEIKGLWQLQVFTPKPKSKETEASSDGQIRRRQEYFNAKRIS